MSSEVEEIRQKLGQLSVEDLQAVKKLADNELRSRAIMEASSFKHGDRVMATCPDGIDRACIVEYANMVTVTVRFGHDGELFRLDPGNLRRI